MSSTLSLEILTPVIDISDDDDDDDDNNDDDNHCRYSVTRGEGLFCFAWDSMSSVSSKKKHLLPHVFSVEFFNENSS